MPRACLKCGHENPDDVDFCQQCGEYVRWELSGVAQAVKAPAPPPVPTAPPPAPAAAPEAPAAAPPGQPPQVEPAPVAPAEVAPPPVADGGSAGAPAEQEAPIEEPPPLPPDAVVLTLRRPEDESASGGQVSTTVEAGGTTTLVALIRNQSGIVDNYDLSVEGIPVEWWSIAPGTVYLVPYGAPGGEYEQEVTLMLSPPRAAEAEARNWELTVVAVSKAHGVRAGAVTGTLEITPYHELETEMRPMSASARRRAAYAIAVRNRANAPVDVQLDAVDPDNYLRFAFQKPRFTVSPGRRNGSKFMVKPPKQAWIGRPVHRRFDITSTVIGSDTGALPQSGMFVQKAWIPYWVLMLVPLLLIAAIAAYLLWPRTSDVPDLTGKQLFAAQELLDEAGLVLGNQTDKPTDEVAPGTILTQSPKAGEEIDEGAAVSIERAVATGRGTVPNLVGMTLAEADQAASKAEFTLAAAQPQNPKTDKIASQVPVAEAVEEKAKPIQIFFAAAAPPETTPTETAPGGTKPKAQATKGDIELPSLAGLTPAAAADALAARGLTPTIAEEFSATVKAGTLIRQEPPKDEKVGEGSKILLVYSKGYPDLIFAQNGNVFAIGTDPKKPRPLANNEQVEEEPAINPVGTLVAYRRGTADAGQIWRMKPDDQLSAKPLTDAGFDDGRPAFSPDGKVIAFTRGKAGDTTADRNLCFVPTAGGKVACIEDANRTLSRPVWSDDGRVILAVARGPQEQQTELLRYTSPRPSSPRPADWTDQGYATDSFHGQQAGEFVDTAAFSPDGKQLAFTANWETGFAHLFLAPFEGGAIGKPKAVPDVRGCELAWRADGLELVVSDEGSSCDDELGQLVRVDPAKPTEQVAMRPGGNPAWSPVVLPQK
jgi:beta-lactam-binding protein with PASTA domain